MLPNDVFCSTICVQPIRGISVLVRAISKIQLSPSQLTSIHADLCKVPLFHTYFIDK